MNEHNFFIGQEFSAYDYFGAHIDGEYVNFRIFAPNVNGVSLMGDFSQWEEIPMETIGGAGIYTLHIKAKIGQMYKYRIFQKDGNTVDHADPFGFGSELRPNWASVITDMRYTWNDSEFTKNRTKGYNEPINIYEVHLGSWLKNPNDEENGWYTYEEIAPKLAKYAKEMGYTHVEVMPLSEHPFDGSWGYQVTGYFCPTSRYGTAVGLKKFVDIMHQNGIAVITDFVPVHFSENSYGLALMDGIGVYEYPTDAGYSEWGTKNFNFFRGEVRSFIQSAANFWLSEFHFDGIRMDAISNCIYWQGDSKRGVNEGAVEFVKNMNTGLHSLHPNAILIAEDSSNYIKVTAPVEYGGLGFDYKWDMGWMNDTLDFFKLDPLFRGDHYNELSFSMMYFYNELYLLPFSHDEVVHGKATIMQKMWGDYEQKFHQCRALYAYMYTHPGKKLNFMGNEIGQFREWDEEKEPDNFLLKYPLHDSFKKYVRDLNMLYLNEAPLHNGEHNPNCFNWLVVDDYLGVTYAYERKAGNERIVVVLNLSGVCHKDYTIKIEGAEELTPLINSDWYCYSGETPEDKTPLKVVDGQFTIPDLPALAAIIFKAEEKTETTEQNTSN